MHCNDMGMFSGWQGWSRQRTLWHAALCLLFSHYEANGSLITYFLACADCAWHTRGNMQMP
jgi:hypothetical protein